MKKNLLKSEKPICRRSSSLIFQVALIVALILTMNISAFALGGLSLSEKVTLQVNNVTLKDAFKEIEKQSEFTFLYNDASIDVNQVISVSTRELSIKDLLDEVLDDKGISYTIVDNQIVLTKSNAKQTETKTVTGSITDSDDGSGLPGVTVLEKGTSNGTITDLDGNYSLTVAEDATLVISYVGYVTEEVSVANVTTMDIALIPDVISLDDVVVIGYGTVKKSDLTGAVASVSAEDLQQSAVSGVDQALQGRTAGVNITANSGTPGAAPSVTIRGMGTTTNPDPLFVIDGMPVSASEVGALNPGDIESTEVLKDASAAAIYGSRGGNGVILITTKKGKKGKANVTYDGYTGVQSVAKKIDLCTAEEWITLRNAAGYTWEDSSAYPNTDWQEEIFRPAGITSHQLSFLGGTDKLRYALIGSMYDQKGIIGQEYLGNDVKAKNAKGSDYRRYTLRVNSSFDVKPWLTVGENISYSYAEQNRIPEQNEWTSTVISALTIDPALPVYLSDSLREKEPNPLSHFSGATRSNVFNPVGVIMRSHDVVRTNKLLGNVYAELKPFKGLTLKTSWGGEFNRDFNEQYFPVFFETIANQRESSTLFNGDFHNNHWLMENTIRYQASFANKHDIQILGGYTRELTSYRYFAWMVNDIPEDPDLWFATNSAAAAEDNEFSDASQQIGSVILGEYLPYDAALISYLGRFIYSYGNIFDFTGSIRRDGSSRFSGKDKWGVFPSFAAGFKFHEMSFMKSQDLISFLKLRAGWGKVGSQEIPDYGAYTSVEYGFNYTFGEYGSQASYRGGAPTSIGNSNQYWEEMVMTNLGLDVNFWNNKLALNIDVYNRVTSDMLVDVPLPLVLGVQRAPFVNQGEVLNQGVEFNLVFKNQVGDFSYNIGANLALMRNEVTFLPQDINSGPLRSAGSVSRTTVGQPIASFYGYVTDGYWQTADEITAANERALELSDGEEDYYDNRRTSAGDIRFADLNENGYLDEGDQTYIGSPHPDLTYGININLEYKSFDLTVFGQGVHGNEVFFGPLFYLESSNLLWNTMSTMNDYWKVEGDETATPRLDQNNGNQNLRFSDRYVYNGSYFRLKNVQLGWTMPQAWSELLKIERARIYVAGQNLLTLSNYPGFDPEIGRGNDFGNNSGTLDIGIDRGMYPLARSYMIGTNITF